MMLRGLIPVMLVVTLASVACGGGGDSSSDSTPGPSASPGATVTPSAGGAPTPTATSQGFTNARQALDAYIHQLGKENIGACPGIVAPGQQSNSVCTTMLYESAELTTFLLSVPPNQRIGELVLTRNKAGDVWAVTFVKAPVAGGELVVGKKAVVFGAGDCLRFRENPSPNAPVFTCQIDGTTGLLTDGPLLVSGITWWRVAGYGWASAEFLGVAAE